MIHQFLDLVINKTSFMKVLISCFTARMYVVFNIKVLNFHNVDVDINTIISCTSFHSWC